MWNKYVNHFNTETRNKEVTGQVLCVVNFTCMGAYVSETRGLVK